MKFFEDWASLEKLALAIIITTCSALVIGRFMKSAEAAEAFAKGYEQKVVQTGARIDVIWVKPRAE